MIRYETRALLALISFCGVVGFAATASWAEGFADLSVGVAMTRDAGVTLSGQTIPDKSATFGTSFTAGGRGGYWFEELPWLGVAGTVSFFQPDVKVPDVPEVGKTDVTVIPLTALLMLRASAMTSNEFPHGRLQPYVGVGPGLFITQASGNAPGFSDTTTDLGVDFRPGMLFLITPHIGVFTEYRFMHYGTKLKDQGVSAETTVDDHQILAGASFHF